MNTVTGFSRGQINLMCFDEMVEADDVVREIDKFVDMMDMSYFKNAKPSEVGRPTYQDKDLMKLYIKGMFEKVFSSRKLEKLCKDSITTKWLMKGLTPDDKTICNFRRDNMENFPRFFKELVRLLHKQGYIEGKLFGIDGTKMRANNAKSKSFSIKRLNEKLASIEKKMAEYFDEVDKADQITQLQERKSRYEGYKQKIQDGEVNEVSVTDPDCRMMKASNGGRDCCYNAHTAVDARNKLLTALHVTNKANDFGTLHDVARDVKENLELENFIVTSDKGYFETAELKKCHDDGIETHVAQPVRTKEEKAGLFPKEDFIYNAETDSYTCPAGQTLPYVYPNKANLKIYRSWKTCRKCPIREKCTKGVNRSIAHHKDWEHEKRNIDAMLRNPQIYEQRKNLCEHPFGTIKKNMGFTQYFTRGKPNVTGETALLFIAYNLKRLINIQKESPKQAPTATQLCKIILLCISMLILQNPQRYPL